MTGPSPSARAGGPAGMAGLLCADVGTLLACGALALAWKPAHHEAGEAPWVGEGRLRHETRCAALGEGGAFFDGTNAGLGEAIACRDVIGREGVLRACRAFLAAGTPYAWPDERHLCPRDLAGGDAR